MKKIFNYALLAAALLVGVNVNATVVNNPADLAATINAANDGDVIQLGGDAVDFIIPDVMDIELGAKTVTLDLNGHNLIYAYNAEAYKTTGEPRTQRGRMIRLKSGILNVINDRKATGGSIENRTDTMPGKVNGSLNLWEGSYSYGYYAKANDTKLTNGSEVVVFSVTGDPATDKVLEKGKVYTKLYIAPEVTVSATKGKVGIIINNENDTKKDYTNPVVSQVGSAFGVVVEVGGKVHGEKYGIQVSGNVNAGPDKFGKGVAFPIINVLSTAEVWSNPVAAVNGNGMYIGGYAIVTIKGYVHGSNGVYIKSGDIDIVDAVIASDNPNYNPTEGDKKGSGTEGSGNAIVIQSSTNYAGETEVTISGDTKVEAQSGYAIQEVVSKGSESKVEGITIDGGTFTGGDEVDGAIVITQESKNDVVINAGSFSDGSANDYINTENGVITPIIDAKGDTVGTMITTDENAPKGQEKTNVTNITDINGQDYVYWDKAFTGRPVPTVVIGETGPETVTIKNFTANAGSITVKEGSTLIIDNPTGEGKKDAKMLLMGDAVVTLEPGAKMISKSTLGVETASAANLIISAQEGKMAQFLYHPSVNQGRHPLATVKYYSRAKNRTTWDRFGVPAFEGITLAQMRCQPTGLTHYIYTWNNVKNDWDQITSLSYVMQPFDGLTLTNNSTGGAVYEFPCAIVGNVNANLKLADGWNSFSNSYTAQTNIKAYLTAILTDFYADIEGTIHTYINGQESATTEDSWNHFSSGDFEDGDYPAKTSLEPMQAFIIKKRTTRTVYGTINYGESVWNPAFPTDPSTPSAPRRMTDMNKVVINLTDAQGNVGRFTIREAADFSADFDNGYDATLYESASKFNFYAATDYANQFQIATDDIEGQVLTLATKGETSFTMTFSNVRGEKMALRDNLTGDVIEMAEGVEYHFMANANEVSERFTVVSAAKAPTAIENAAVKAKAAKFINKGQVVLQNNGRTFNVLGVEL